MLLLALLSAMTGCAWVESAAEKGVEKGFEQVKEKLPELIASSPEVAGALTGIRAALEATGTKDEVIASLTEVAEDKRADGGLGGVLTANLVELIVLLLGGGAAGGFVLGKRKAKTNGGAATAAG